MGRLPRLTFNAVGPGGFEVVVTADVPYSPDVAEDLRKQTVLLLRDTVLAVPTGWASDDDDIDEDTDDAALVSDDELPSVD